MPNADSVVIDLIAKVDKADADVKRYAANFEASMKRVEASSSVVESKQEQRARRDIARRLRLQEAIRKESNQVVVSAAQAANATRNLGRQVADVGVGLASGQSIFLILAQQAPQVADALTDVGGKAARVASFFAGPWGAALLAAGSILGVLAGNLLSASDAADTKKKAAKSLTDAIRELNDETSATIRTSEQSAQAQYAEAGGLLEKARAARVAYRDILKLALAEAESRRAAGQGTGATAGAGGGMGQAMGQIMADKEVIRLRGALAQATTNVATATDTVRKAQIPLLNQRAAEATDAATAATKRYERSLARLNEQRVADKISDDEYVRQQTTLIRTRDAALDKIRSAPKESRSAEAAAKKEARELQSALVDVQNAFDPAAASAREYAKVLRDIADLKAVGAISPEAAETYSNAARLAKFAKQQAEDDAEEAKRNGIIEGIRGRPGGISDASDRFETAIKSRADDRMKAELGVNNRLAEDQEARVRDLASIYEDAFLGGTGSIWEQFKREGVKAIALLLAKFTVLQAAQGGGGFGNILGNLGKAASSAFGGSSFGGLGSLFGNSSSIVAGDQSSKDVADVIKLFPGFGRASGGHVSAGQLVRVNEGASPGNVEGWRPQGSGDVIPLGRMKAARGGGMTIVNAPQFNLRGAVVTKELYADMERISASSARRAAGGAFVASQRSAPGTIAQYQKLKG